MVRCDPPPDAQHMAEKLSPHTQPAPTLNLVPRSGRAVAVSCQTGGHITTLKSSAA